MSCRSGSTYHPQAETYGPSYTLGLDDVRHGLLPVTPAGASIHGS